MRNSSAPAPRITLEHGYYDVATLRAGLLELEAAYGMSSIEFFERYRNDESLDIRLFHQNLWATYFEEFQRLSTPDELVERAGRAAVIVTPA